MLNVDLSCAPSELTHGDDGNRNSGGDQTVLDGGGAGLIQRNAFRVLMHVSCRSAL